MTALDIIVLFLLGGGAVFGFMRGFVQEALSLIAWIMIIAAVRILHGPATAALAEAVGTESGAAVLAFLAIVIVIFALGRWIAKSIGKKSRQSVLGRSCSGIRFWRGQRPDWCNLDFSPACYGVRNPVRR
jgi:membrane protein required for colicin V production